MKSTKSSKPPSIAKQLLGEILAGLDIREEDLLTAARIQPFLFEKVATYRKLSMEELGVAKMALAELEARTGMQLREEATSRGEKITEKVMEELLVTDDDVLEARKVYMRATESDEYAKLMVEAYRMRRDSIRASIDLVKGEEISLRDAGKMASDLQKKQSVKFPKGYK